MKIDSLTFQSILCTSGRIAFMCPEVGLCELPFDDEESISRRIENLAEQCEEVLVVLWDTGELEETPVLAQLLQCIDLEDTRYNIESRHKEWAVIRNYPSLQDHWNVKMAIPSPDWDMPQENWYESKSEFKQALAQWHWEEKAEKEAWDALIYRGKDEPKWIQWIQWITKEKLPSYVKSQQREVWERWKNTGLPVLSFKETLGK